MIAALFVQRRGVYADLPGVEVWDRKRDARLYAGPWPVVAHPPCSTWCQLAPVNQARYGHRVGDDGGCFAAALASVMAVSWMTNHRSPELPRIAKGAAARTPAAFRDVLIAIAEAATASRAAEAL